MHKKLYRSSPQHDVFVEIRPSQYDITPHYTTTGSFNGMVHEILENEYSPDEMPTFIPIQESPRIKELRQSTKITSATNAKAKRRSGRHK